MSRPLEPDVKAIRAIRRAVEGLDALTRNRVLEYVSPPHGSPWNDVACHNARMAETLRWVRKETVLDSRDRDLIDRALKARSA